ncbi:MAG TPA: M20/M25/M40 family metallo-hydrolase [Candidatus Thermoplasmatota archaeon]|nr:M20/M25/M40 family metallo-hydrolase [Candidatus Thermoplasmatota archaeon]
MSSDTAPPPLADLDLLRALVAIPSPTGQEAAAVAFLQEQARRDGFRVQSDGAGNFLAEAGRGTRLVMLVGHVDTVHGHIPVREEAGELWGRGSVDAKGPLAAFYCAARRHLDDPDLRILVAGCVDEEGDSHGAKALPRDLRPEAIVVGEPSGVDGITLGYKGIVRGVFRAEVPAVHGGHPGQTGPDALVAWWSGVQRAFAFQDGFATPHGHLDHVATTSDGLLGVTVARFQVRLPPGLAPGLVADRLQEMALDVGATVEVTERMPAAETGRRNALVAALSASIRQEGHVVRPKRKTGTADFNHLAQWHAGVPMVAYGPGDSHLDHSPSERVALAEFTQSVAVLDRALATLARLPRALDPAVVASAVQ